MDAKNEYETFWEMMEERIAKGELCSDCHKDMEDCDCNDEVECASCNYVIKRKELSWGEMSMDYLDVCNECYQITQATIELVEPCFVCNYPCLTKIAIDGMCAGCEQYHRCDKGDCLCGACELQKEIKNSKN